MEDGHQEINDYQFLQLERIEKHFAEINYLLLSGKHIDQRDYVFHSLLTDYIEQWKNYYLKLYDLNLVPDIFDGQSYFYLDFGDSGKGKLNDPLRQREITPLQTLVGLLLLDMYYQKYFEREKIVTWNDLMIQILESDHEKQYKQILFGEIRASYDEKEWSLVQKRFLKALITFSKLGWINIHNDNGRNFSFEIRPAIHRLEKLYQEELNDFEVFSERFINQREI